MFKVYDDYTIAINRGDVGCIDVSAKVSDDESYMFTSNDVVRLRVFEKNHHEKVVLVKDADPVVGQTETVSICLIKEDTKFCEIINKPKEYWYEIELNPDTDPMTIVGYDDNGAKVFKLFPEGADE